MEKVTLRTAFTLYEGIHELDKQDNDLFEKAVEARKKAYSPYSNFNVGASILLSNGKIVTGNNQENAAYPSGMCAERVAIWSAASLYPEASIVKIFISATSVAQAVTEPVSPCGSCRQAIAEYEIKQKEKITLYFTGESGGILKADSIKDLLPLLFDKDLLP